MHQFVARPFYRPDSEELRFLPECPRLLRNLRSEEPLLGWVSIQHAMDAKAGSINLLNLGTGKNASYLLPGRPGFFVETDQPGILLIGMERRLVLFDLASAQLVETGVQVPEDERVIINDGIAIPGGLLFGTKHLDFRERIAALYHLDIATKRLAKLMPEVCSNGKYFLPDSEGANLIEIDSQPKTITRYRLDKSFANVLASSLVVPPDSLPAFPDGLRQTPNGESIVVALYQPDPGGPGSALEIRLGDGAILTEWSIPGSARVTCPEFVWLDGRVQLIFTTATEGMASELRPKAPEAGTLFCADTPFETLPQAPPLVTW